MSPRKYTGIPNSCKPNSPPVLRPATAPLAQRLEYLYGPWPDRPPVYGHNSVYIHPGLTEHLGKKLRGDPGLLLALIVGGWMQGENPTLSCWSPKNDRYLKKLVRRKLIYWTPALPDLVAINEDRILVLFKDAKEYQS